MKNSIVKSSKTKSTLENTMLCIFFVCGAVSILSVVLISLYMLISGGPAIAQIGVFDFLFGKTWNPDSAKFGILPLILSSLFATGLAILIAVPIGLFTAIFLTYIANKRISSVFSSTIELLAGIPSVVYGLLGAILIVPLIFKIQTMLALPSGGSLATAAIVLTIMILPTIISVSVTAIKAAPKEYFDASLALGASKLESVFRAIIPAAKSGIAAGIVLGVGRAIGETMAVIMVAGNAAIMPELFKPARLLTVGISMEWAYSSGMHRQALYGIGLVLFIFIMIINIILSSLLKKAAENR